MVSGFIAGGRPTWATQNFEFGALTKAGAGAVQIVSTIGAITSASITAGDASGHWSISASGALSPSSTGDTADLNAGPYTLTVLLNGTLSITVVIAILSGVWSVATATEWQTAGQHTSLALGNQIHLRTGVYNIEQADVRITRSSAPSGTFVAPSLIDPDHPRKGHNLDSANYVVCKPHNSARPIIHRIQLNNSSGGSKYFRFSGLKNYRPVIAAIGDPSPTGVAFINSCTDCAIDNCEYSSVDNGTDTSIIATHAGIYMAGSNARHFIQNNHIHDISSGISVNGPDIEIVGNRVHDFWIDGVRKDGDPTNFLYAWNKVYNCRSYDAAVGAHPDFLQFVITGTSSYDNVQIIGNLHWRGNGRETYGDGQGYFALSTGSPGFITNVVHAGNVYLGSFVRGISYFRLQGMKINNNTVIYDFHGDGAPNGGFGHTDIVMDTCDGGEIKNNIVEISPGNRISEVTPILGATISNNVNGDPDAVSGASSFAELFMDFQNGPGMTDPLTQLAVKVGSAADTASPKAGAIGTGYVDFAKRETYFPWE